MAFKEVTALRKSGKLEQALEMARADYNHLQDYWGCVGLFWCLNDKYKLVKELVERRNREGNARTRKTDTAQ
ncbi:hypothetical protein [Prevotella intermedia]|uniref:hypothetical protein n=1 Tax=Prevotella intermedia TaxID=28131 RepID=UPI0012DA5257|nr:hypothetical protein [Prevotella intermedia]